MQARFASGFFLVLGVADLAVLNLVLAPKLVTPPERDTVSRSTPTPAQTTAGRPAAPSSGPAALAQTAVSAPPRSAPPPAPKPIAARQGRAALDVRFSLQSELVTSIEGAGALDRLATELAADPTLGVVLRGHADRLGRPAHNLVLSQRRAEAVKRYLVMRGAPGDRIDVEAAGDTEPLDPDDTPAAWSKNRRVEVRWREASSR